MRIPATIVQAKVEIKIGHAMVHLAMGVVPVALVGAMVGLHGAMDPGGTISSPLAS